MWPPKCWQMTLEYSKNDEVSLVPNLKKCSSSWFVDVWSSKVGLNDSFSIIFQKNFGFKRGFFHSGWWFSTNQWFKNQNYISGSKQDSNHISIFIVASSYLQILALHFWCMRSCSSQFKEEGKNLKGYHQKIAYKKEMTFWNKKYRINFCFLLRSS